MAQIKQYPTILDHDGIVDVGWVKRSATQHESRKLNMDIGVGFPYVNPTYNFFATGVVGCSATNYELVLSITNCYRHSPCIVKAAQYTGLRQFGFCHKLNCAARRAATGDFPSFHIWR